LFLYRYRPFDLLGEKVNGESVCGLVRREDKESLLNYEGCDVIEAPSQRIYLRERTMITYGTVGEGIDLARDFWEKQVQQFTSQKRDLASQETKAIQLGPLNRLKKNILDEEPVKALLLEGCGASVWLKWLKATAQPNDPK
jgi:hypothetical protein